MALKGLKNFYMVGIDSIIQKSEVRDCFSSKISLDITGFDNLNLIMLLREIFLIIPEKMSIFSDL